MRRALVTGAGKRLGRAMALYLAERGFDVAVHFATSRTAAEETAADIAAQGQRASLLQAN
ncbi:SDR family NAD(P)-dependent oxidoreductase, partial [Henriciella sp.]|uniref:SDR family NAD(P)-dependent oxidoreductase n=1 Tax=Henriciella sp. TaxID=1968823 RepID=UPI0017C618BB